MKRLLAKDRSSVGLEAHEQLATQTAELQKEKDTLRDQGKQVPPGIGLGLGLGQAGGCRALVDHARC